jgi:phosphoglycolate phosphatase
VKGRRLYLFDIDGTLIATGGAGGKAMAAAFQAVWRIADGFAGVEFSGRTDRAILRDALGLTKAGGDIFASDLARFKRAYYRRLGGTLRSTEGVVLPGAVPLLERLGQDPAASVGLATGNFRHSARMKLGHYGLATYFSLGGFGDRSEDRAEMVADAIHAFRRHGRHDTVFVIGDTAHDIRSAKANKAIAVGVTTGTYSGEALSEAGADIVLASLEEAEGQIL